MWWFKAKQDRVPKMPKLGTFTNEELDALDTQLVKDYDAIEGSTIEQEAIQKFRYTVSLFKHKRVKDAQESLYKKYGVRYED